jgi:hypothetical protein
MDANAVIFLLCVRLFQIHEEARKFSYQIGVRVVVAYGGAPITQQVWFFICSFNFNVILLMDSHE